MTDAHTRRTLWLVRHGMRIDFVDPAWVTTAEHPHDPPLHPDGFVQAVETARRLRSEAIDNVFASPFQRTLQTALAIAGALETTVSVEAGLAEFLDPREFGLNPLTNGMDGIHRAFPGTNSEYRSAVEPAYPEDQEALDQRAELVVSRLINGLCGSVVMISHGSPLQAIFRAITGRPQERMPTMCSITRFDYVNGRWSLVMEADTSHLTNPDRSDRLFRFQ